MPSKLSSDELFHFTKFENLLSILDQGFQPRYNLEHTFLSDMYKRPSAIAAIPMVCFCDIPLDMVEEHSTKYGKCAIGLDKSWGEKYGVSPVIYIHKNSRIGDAVSSLGNSFDGYSSSMIKEGSDMNIFFMISNSLNAVSHLSYYVKQYERTNDEHYIINDKKYSFKKGRFYDEREWRFVPPMTPESFWLINVDTMENQEELEKAHNNLIKHSLKFSLDDIRYIVCETKDEKEKLENAIALKFDTTKEQIISKIKFHLSS